MPSKFDSIRCVVFDAVGTLIYPNPRVEIVYHQLGHQHGSHLSQEETARNFRHAFKHRGWNPRSSEKIERDCWKKVVSNTFADLDDTESLFVALWNHFAQPSSWAVYDDAPEIFARLFSRGLVTAIGSNFDARLLTIARELTPLNQARAVFVSSQVGFSKPNPRFFRAIEKSLQLGPDQLMMVGDNPVSDIKGASRAGWKTLLLDRHGAPGNGSHLNIIELFT